MKILLLPILLITSFSFSAYANESAKNVSDDFFDKAEVLGHKLGDKLSTFYPPGDGLRCNPRSYDKSHGHIIQTEIFCHKEYKSTYIVLKYDHNDELIFVGRAFYLNSGVDKNMVYEKLIAQYGEPSYGTSNPKKERGEDPYSIGLCYQSEDGSCLPRRDRHSDKIYYIKRGKKNKSLHIEMSKKWGTSTSVKIVFWLEDFNADKKNYQYKKSIEKAVKDEVSRKQEKNLKF